MYLRTCLPKTVLSWLAYVACSAKLHIVYCVNPDQDYILLPYRSWDGTGRDGMRRIEGKMEGCEAIKERDCVRADKVKRKTG